MRVLIAAAAAMFSAASLAAAPQQDGAPGGESLPICAAQRSLGDEAYLSTAPGVGGSGLAGTDSEEAMIFRDRGEPTEDGEAPWHESDGDDW